MTRSEIGGGFLSQVREASRTSADDGKSPFLTFVFPSRDNRLGGIQNDGEQVDLDDKQFDLFLGDASGPLELHQTLLELNVGRESELRMKISTKSSTEEHEDVED